MFLWCIFVAVACMYELVLEYYELFGDKPCCFNDIRLYVDVLSQEQKERVRSITFRGIIKGFVSQFY